MMRRYFGTDGIRGCAGVSPMTAETALSVAQAAGAYFARDARKHRVVIGKDTRLSCYMIEHALVAGFTAAGLDVLLLGPMPTPAVARITPSMRADLGVMISASHNPYYDNGIKLFDRDGFKLSDTIESEIEDLMEKDGYQRAQNGNLGRVRRLEGAAGRYIEAVKRSFPENMTLKGVKVALDCANGAAYHVAPTVLYELGAEVIPSAISPDGVNINACCGATDTRALEKLVVKSGADIGIALDGDADRLIVVDEKGKRIDGDQVMALIAQTWALEGKLKGGGLVATQMSNMGLERCLQNQGLDMVRAQVGDRYVLEQMRQGGYNLGGEQSGHLIALDYGTTGDGLVAALQVLSCLCKTEKAASELLNCFTPFPQYLKNVPYKGENPLENGRVKGAIRTAEAQFEGWGRILVRKSGTEPVVRVMGEGEDAAEVQGLVDGLVGIIEEVVL